MTKELPQLAWGNTLLWYDGPVVSWASLRHAQGTSTGITQSLPDDTPHDHIFAVFDDQMRHRFMRDELCLRQLMDSPSVELWAIDETDHEARLSRLERPIQEIMLPYHGVTWSTMSGNDRARR